VDVEHLVQARTCFDMPQSLSLPPPALSFRKHHRNDPSPELSMNRSRLRSITILMPAESAGARSRLSSRVLLASSSSTAMVTTATLATFSITSSIGAPPRSRSCGS
jgi:hypothetical protein